MMLWPTQVHDDAPIDDAALLKQVAAGDLTALEQLFARYQRQLYQLALGVTRDPQTAEEVLQDTFYRLHQHAAQLDGSSPLLPWLYRVAANLSYNQARRSAYLGRALPCAGRSPVRAILALARAYRRGARGSVDRSCDS